jgi:hypothetical protein
MSFHEHVYMIIKDVHDRAPYGQWARLRGPALNSHPPFPFRKSPDDSGMNCDITAIMTGPG